MKLLGNRLRVPKYLVVYVLLSISILFLFLTGVIGLAVIVTPIMPLVLIVGLSKKLDCIFDFRVVYLGAIFIWSLGKSLSLIFSSGVLEIDGGFVPIYIMCMIVAPSLAIIFTAPNPDVYFQKSILPYKNNRLIFILIIVWFFATTVLFITFYTSKNSAFGFLAKQLTQGFVLVYTSMLVMLLFRRKSVGARVLLIFVIIYVLATFLQGATNRTSLLFPITISLATIISVSKINSLNIFNYKIVSIFILALPFVISILFLADFQKQTNLNLFEGFSLIVDRPDIIIDVIQKNNYLADNTSGKSYFHSMNKIIDSDKFIYGGLLYQFVSSIMPRFFFPNKSDTDLSLIMWKNDLLPAPLYYEIFLEPTIDSSIFGVLIYFFLFLSFVSISWRSVKMHRVGFRSIYSRAVYILNLYVLFMIIRGPAIFLIWFALLPNIVVWWWLLRRRINYKSFKS